MNNKLVSKSTAILMKFFGCRFYKITGPKVIRPNSEYNVAISVQATSVPTVVRAAIEGVAHDGKPYSVEDAVTALPYSTKTARLEVTNKI